MLFLSTDQLLSASGVPSLRASGVRIAFNRPVLGGIDLDLIPGEVTCVVGRSGVGKTTLLNILAGLQIPDDGTVTLNGRSIDRHDVGYLMQANVLLPWLTLRDNVAMPLVLHGQSRSAARFEAEAFLERMDLRAAADAYPPEVSGGMARRACLARALLRPSPVLLLDEPFTGIDYDLQLSLENVITRLVAERQCTALVVTHSLEGAVAIGSRAIVIARGPEGSFVSATLNRLSMDANQRLTPVAIRSDASFSQNYQRVLAAYRKTLEEADGRERF